MGSPRSSPPWRARTIVTFSRVHGCIVEQRCYTPGCTCKTRTATCEGGRRGTPGLHLQPRVPCRGTGGGPWKRVRSKGSLHLSSKKRAGPQRFPPRESSRKRGRGLRQAVKSHRLSGTHSGPAPEGQADATTCQGPRGQRASLCPTDKGKMTALGHVAAKAATCPALPLAPRFPHHGGSSS